MPRPSPRFHEFIGQRNVVNRLRRQLEGALAKGEPFPHSLFLGPSGVGKTRLARALAAEYGTTMKTAMGFETPEQLTEKMMGLNSADFLFVDECHRLGGPEQELFFQAIDSGCTPVPRRKRDKPSKDNCQPVVLKPFTLVLATDQPGELLNALHNRIEQKVHIDYYSDVELKEIVASMSHDLNMLVSPQAAKLVARIAGGLPRNALHILKGMRRYHTESETEQLTAQHVREFLDAEGIDAHGLDDCARRYLQIVARPGGASLETIALTLGLDAPYVRAQIESMLVRHALVRITPAGRQLTDAGRSLVAGMTTSAEANNTEEEPT